MHTREAVRRTKIAVSYVQYSDVFNKNKHNLPKEIIDHCDCILKAVEQTKIMLNITQQAHKFVQEANGFDLRRMEEEAERATKAMEQAKLAANIAERSRDIITSTEIILKENTNTRNRCIIS